jgi:hypothetical protein
MKTDCQNRRLFTPGKKILTLTKQGEYDKAKKLLPIEKIYPLSREIARRIGSEI